MVLLLLLSTHIVARVEFVVATSHSFAICSAEVGFFFFELRNHMRTIQFQFRFLCSRVVFVIVVVIVNV